MDSVDLPHSDHGPRNALAVVLLHGFPLDHRMWRFQKEAFERAGFRVIIPDLRGFGKAPAARGPTTMREYAGDVLRMLDRAGVQRFVLGGFSMGGYVAFEVVRQARDRLAGLLLVDTRMEPDSDEARAGRAKTADSVRAQGMQVLVDAMLPKMLTKDAQQQLSSEVREAMLANRPEGMIAALQAMGARPDSRETLQGLRVPTLIVVGQEDPITPPDAAKAMAALIPGAKVHVVQGAAHLTPMQKPDEVNDVVMAWLRTIR